MMTRCGNIIHFITPLKTKNERNFSLAGIYTAWRRSNISIEILSGFIFINRKITGLGLNTPIDFFGGSLDALADIFDQM